MIVQIFLLKFQDSIFKQFCYALIYLWRGSTQKCLDKFYQIETMIQKDDKFEYIDTFYLYKGMAQLKFKEGNPIDSFQTGLRYNNKNIQIWKQIIILMKNDNYVAQQSDLIDYIQNIDDIKIDSQFLLLKVGLCDEDDDKGYQKIFNSIQKVANIQNKYLLKIYTNFKLQLYQKSRQICNEYLDINSDNGLIYVLLGNISFKQNKNIQAQNYYKQGLQLMPDTPQIYYNLGMLKYRSYLYEQSLQYFEKAIKLNPQFSQGYYQLVQACIKINSYESASSKIESLFVKDQNPSYEYLYCMGELLYQKQNYEEALKYFENAQQKQPHRYQCIYKLGMITFILQRQKGGFEKNRHIQLLKQQQFDKVQFLSLYACILTAEKQIEQSMDVHLRCISKYPQQAESYFHLGVLLNNKQKNMNYLEEIEDNFRKSQDNNVYYLQSLLRLGLKDYQNFISVFSRYIDYYKNELNINQKQGKKQVNSIYRKIILQITHLLRFYPHNKDLLILMGRLQRDIGALSKSRNYCNRVLFKQNKQNKQNKQDKQNKQSKQKMYITYQNLIQFYNKNNEYHKKQNYLYFIYEYLFEQLLDRDIYEGIKFYGYLKGAQFGFKDNEMMKYIINNKKFILINLQMNKIIQNWNQLFKKLDQDRNIAFYYGKYLKSIFQLMGINRQIKEFKQIKDLIKIAQWNTRVLSINDKQFKNDLEKINQFEKDINKFIAKNTIDNVKIKILHFIMYKYYFNQISIYFIEDQTILSSIFNILHQLINSTDFGTLFSVKQGISSILTKSFSSYIDKTIDQRYSSHILFDFEEEQKIQLSSNHRSLTKIQQIFKNIPRSNIKKQSLLSTGINTFQTKLVKKKIQHKSLIQVTQKDLKLQKQTQSTISCILDTQDWDL